MKTKTTAVQNRPVSQSDETPSTLDAATRQDIRRRAYEIFKSRHGSPGNPLLDWLEAEQELRAARTATAHRS